MEELSISCAVGVGIFTEGHMVTVLLGVLRVVSTAMIGGSEEEVDSVEEALNNGASVEAVGVGGRLGEPDIAQNQRPERTWDDTEVVVV